MSTLLGSKLDLFERYLKRSNVFVGAVPTYTNAELYRVANNLLHDATAWKDVDAQMLVQGMRARWQRRAAATRLKQKALIRKTKIEKQQTTLSF